MKTYLIIFLLVSSAVSYSQVREPLVVVNGTALVPDSQFAEEIPIEQILSLRTYEPQEATSMYGEFLGGGGIIEIKTRPNTKGFISIPDHVRLTYGDTNPIVVLDGKKIDYEKLNELNISEIRAIEVNRNIDYVKDWGLQSINGLVRITSR